mgnify:CR=1 FL=1
MRTAKKPLLTSPRAAPSSSCQPPPTIAHIVLPPLAQPALLVRFDSGGKRFPGSGARSSSPRERGERERVAAVQQQRELGGAAKVARRLRQALSTGSSPQQMSKVRHERTCGRAIHVERGHGGCPSIPCRVGAWGQRPALADAAADRGRQRLRHARGHEPRTTPQTRQPPIEWNSISHKAPETTVHETVEKTVEQISRNDSPRAI